MDQSSTATATDVRECSGVAKSTIRAVTWTRADTTDTFENDLVSAILMVLLARRDRHIRAASTEPGVTAEPRP
ncbi:hypothetical protein [Rathayibacter soli]|uniref:hypothetical protein n=1 Tax=Rathayibacter soli TaxID=3144168 RepID=UPI0027E5B56E|nr:hypothetical protein [Glaciibacter superstes]